MSEGCKVETHRMKSSDPPIPHPPTTLFTIRVWHETLGAESGTMRMEVKHVLSGETRYFQEWGQVMAYVEGKLTKKNDSFPASRLLC